MWYNFAFVACLIPATLAIFPDEAYKVDYQHALLGLPQHQTTFFHQPQVGSKASLIYTLSEKSLLGAVNPKDGSLVWRQQLPNASNSSDSFLRAGENQDVVISGLDQQVAAWSAADGKLVWSNEYETPGAVKDLEILEIPEGASGAASKDVIVLIQGESRIVQRLNWKTGSIKWQYTDGRYVVGSSIMVLVLTSPKFRYSFPGVGIGNRSLLPLLHRFQGF
jgi:ER membrane protein complex subunit 1